MEKIVQNIIFRKNKGFTLVELLLYVGISSFILSAVVFFASSLIQTQTKNRTTSEVNEQGIILMQFITQTIRNAESINYPTTGENSTQLSLGVGEAIKNPTIFRVDSGAFQVQEGANIDVLTNSKVTVVNERFTNLSLADTPGVIKIDFTLSYVNPSQRNEFNYAKTFTSTVSLR